MDRGRIKDESKNVIKCTLLIQVRKFEYSNEKKKTLFFLIKLPSNQANGPCYVASTTEAIDTGGQVKLNVHYS